MNNIEKPVTEVSRNFSDYLNRVAYKGERFLLMRGKKPVAELNPVPSGRKAGDLPGILRSLPKLAAKEAKAFAKDLKQAKKAVASEELKDPWASS